MQKVETCTVKNGYVEDDVLGIPHWSSVCRRCGFFNLFGMTREREKTEAQEMRLCFFS